MHVRQCSTNDASPTSRSACSYKNLIAGEGRDLLFIKYVLMYEE